ncbi:hypothetical protein SAMN05444851_3254 [Aliiroseovarius sediminilitoris]|uniref:Uncharacterized protein n=1 Tax=Aliiroseovarius sediminilitoris TaxID=1173584 RepID=A0A1I0R8V2_9RHOB|nr:hypothetical protein [Aliiroseovarius sediminilitoris]SEW37229.1 hypothetical protein SAMN05444851_3254 [Aliiroseovarius sediminilitoris]
MWAAGGISPVPVLVAGLFLSVASPAWAQNEAWSLGETDPAPVVVNGGVAYLAPVHLPPPPLTDRPTVRVTFPTLTNAPVLGPKKKKRGHQLLAQLVAQGKAAGNRGDLYDNRDRGHSRLNVKAHPQLTELLYHPVLRDQNIDYGAAVGLLFDVPVIGNSSTALTAGPFARSVPRMVLTGMQPVGAEALYQNYVNGQIHVYPSYRDHEPGGKDMLPANTPYYIISQGSSGSDQPHLEALAMILAAFRPDTKARLMETGLLASTVQMVFRRSRNQVRERGAYLAAVAHPTAFPAEGINLERLVALANAIQPDNIPPMVQLSVLEEPENQPGVDVFGDGLSERLFDTPSAIARVWRSHRYKREMVLSAKDTVDPNGRPLTFNWVLLRGDRRQVTIAPLDDTGTSARITIGWQGPSIVAGSDDVSSSRVDIAVIAYNGVYDSAPAFLSVLLPDHETRYYSPGPEADMRITRLVRTARDGQIFDPVVFPRTDWADDFTYDGTSLTGWVRRSEFGEQSFDAEGKTGGKQPRYPIVEGVDGLPAVVQQTQ